MANLCNGKRVILDNFSSDVKLSDFVQLSNSSKSIVINSIEWNKPTTVGHTCDIYELTGGAQIPMFNQECTEAKLSLIKYFHGLEVDDVIIPAGSVKSGKVLIILDNAVRVRKYGY